MKILYLDLMPAYALFAVQCSASDGSKTSPTADALTVYEIDGTSGTVGGTAISGSPFDPAQFGSKIGLWAVKIAKESFVSGKQYLFLWEMTVDGKTAAKQEIWTAVNAASFQADVSGITGDLTTLLGRLTAPRAGYLDKLNVSGVIANTDNANAFKASTVGLSVFDAAVDTVITDLTGVAMQTDIQTHGDSVLAALTGLPALVWDYSERGITEPVTVGYVGATPVTSPDDFKADVSGLSTFDPTVNPVTVGNTLACQADLSGVTSDLTTLLGRITAPRAAYLDNLNISGAIATTSVTDGLALEETSQALASQISGLASDNDTILASIVAATEGLSTFDYETDFVLVDLAGVAMQTDIQAHQDYMATTLSGLGATLSNISNVVRLNVSLPAELPLPETGTTLVRCDISLHDADGNMEDPDNDYLTVNAFDIYESSRNNRLFKDSAGTTPLDTVPSGDLTGKYYAVKQDTGLYSFFFAVSATDLPEQIVFKLRWVENGINLYEFKAFQVVNAPVLADIQTGIAAVRERTDRLPDDPAGMAAINTVLGDATAGLSVFNPVADLVRVGYIQDDMVTSAQDFWSTQAAVDLTPILDRLPAETPAFLAHLDADVSSISGDIGAMITGPGIQRVTFMVKDDIGIEIPDFVLSIRVSAGAPDIVPRLQTGVDGVAVATLENGMYFVQGWRAGWGIVAQEITVSGDMTVDIVATQAAGAIPQPAAPYHCVCYVQLAGDAEATARISELPYAYGGIYQTGDELAGEWDAENGLMSWELPYGATVLFSIPSYRILTTAVVPIADSFVIL